MNPSSEAWLQERAWGRLKDVFSPRVVGVPPTNAIRDLRVLPDGEIRHYGFRGARRAGGQCLRLPPGSGGLVDPPVF
ncbi:MAG TPA: hypothetical protein VIO38_04080, partial [Rariglobus sp.]